MLLVPAPTCPTLDKATPRELYAGLDNPDFNLTVDTLRHDDGDGEFFLWHMRFLPRLTMPAGFELGSGMSINTVLPEEAASYLRDAAT
jgi:UDPglucose--hexose-1-phosphate uridylyltransferase